MAHNVAGSWARRRGKVVESEQQRKHICQMRHAKKAQWEVEALPGSLALLDHEGKCDCGFKALGAQLAPLHCKLDL